MEKTLPGALDEQPQDVVFDGRQRDWLSIHRNLLALVIQADAAHFDARRAGHLNAAQARIAPQMRFDPRHHFDGLKGFVI